VALESAGDEMFFRRPEISFRMAIAALSVLVFSGIFAGMIPARRAVKIKPIDAIREEK
jgi:putative ABC transport system permease protein